jgi:predicted DNA-binding protein YlxM (UPF0122 family)
MAVGQETKRKIIELYFTQHKNIREIAKEVQKSSRDIVAMVKEHKQELQQSQPSMSLRDDVDQQKEVDFIRSPINVRAYELFSKGLTPPQVALELKLSEEDTTSYYTEYLRLAKLPDLGYL